MFLQADRIPAIIKNMQEQTSIGGYNLDRVCYGYRRLSLLSQLPIHL